MYMCALSCPVKIIPSFHMLPKFTNVSVDMGYVVHILEPLPCTVYTVYTNALHLLSTE